MMDYDNMPAGEEMDVEVASLVFGQTDFSHLPVVYEEGNTPDGKDGWSGFVCPRCRHSQGMLNHPCVQNYSSDISKAWEVVEELSKKLVVDVVKFDRKEGYPPTYYECIVTVFGNIEHVSLGKSDSAPLAICRAALKVASPKSD